LVISDILRTFAGKQDAHGQRRHYQRLEDCKRVFWNGWNISNCRIAIYLG